MSADNYIYVRQRPDGRFGFSHSSASAYYEDEGHTVESVQEENPQYNVDADWINPAEEDIEVFDTPGDAIAGATLFANSLPIVEYGIQLGEGVDA